MTLNDYQKAAERTSGDLTSWDKVRNGCYGLNGEAGECIDILKKTEFQGHAFDFDGRANHLHEQIINFKPWYERESESENH